MKARFQVPGEKSSFLYSEGNYNVALLSSTTESPSLLELQSLKNKHTNKLILIANSSFELENQILNPATNKYIDKLIYKKESNTNKISQDILDTISILYPSEEEAIALISQTMNEELHKRMSFIGDQRNMDNLISSVISNISTKKTVAIYNNNSLVGLFVFSKLTIFQKQSDLVSWVWIKDNLDEKIKNNVGTTIFIESMNSNCLCPNTYASINTENSRSIRFFKHHNFNLEGIAYTL